jgi:hypothetical protein
MSNIKPSLPVITVRYRTSLDAIIKIVGPPEGWEEEGDGEFSERQSDIIYEALKDGRDGPLEGAERLDIDIDF